MKWYNVKAKVEGSEKIAEIAIEGEIGWDVSLKGLMSDVDAAGPVDRIHLVFNSPGGDMWTGIALASYLKSRKETITGHVAGLCASAATLPLSVCSRSTIGSSAYVMTHGASSFVYGNAEEIESQLEIVKSADRDLINFYSAKTGKSAEEVRSFVTGENWFQGSEAVTAGLVDAVDEESSPVAAHAADYRAKLQARGFTVGNQYGVAGCDPGPTSEDSGADQGGEKLPNEPENTESPDESSDPEPDSGDSPGAPSPVPDGVMAKVQSIGLTVADFNALTAKAARVDALEAEVTALKSQAEKTEESVGKKVTAALAELGVPSGDLSGSDAQPVFSETEFWAQYGEIEDPYERGKFWAQHKEKLDGKK